MEGQSLFICMSKSRDYNMINFITEEKVTELLEYIAYFGKT